MNSFLLNSMNIITSSPDPTLYELINLANLSFDTYVNGYFYKQQCIACSSDGQYVSVCGNGGVYRSNNYGTSFTFITTPFDTFNGGFQGLNLFAISMSASGQYQMTASSAHGTTAACNIYVSNNHGVSWTTIETNITTNNWGRWIQSCYVSPTGQYMIAGGGGGAGLWNLISVNYGVSFTRNGNIYNRPGSTFIPLISSSTMIAFNTQTFETPPNYILTPITTLTENKQTISTSNIDITFRVTNDQSGNYISMCTYGNQIYVTNNGQQVISPTGAGPSTEWTTIVLPSSGINNICYSSDGSLLIAMNSTSLLKSTTHGLTWSTINFTNGNNIFYSILSSDGNMLYCVDQTKKLYSYTL